MEAFWRNAAHSGHRSSSARRAFWAMGVVLAFVSLLPAQGRAQALTEAQMTALAQSVASFEALFEDGIQAEDFAASLAYVPPGMVANMAAKAGLSAEELVDLVPQTMVTLFDSLGWPEMRFDIGWDAADFGVSSTGRPYAVMSSWTELVGIASGTSPTVAILDEDTWFLVRLEQPTHFVALYETYPDLVGIEIPEGEMHVAE